MILQFGTSPAVRVEFVQLSPKVWPLYRKGVLRLERRSFPPSIRDNGTSYDKLIASGTGVFVVARRQSNGRLLGFCCGNRLNQFGCVPDAKTDAHRTKSASFYLSSVAVDATSRGLGLGVALQRRCVALARRKAYRRITAHLRASAASKIFKSVRILASHDDWYDTGERYDYVLIGGAGPKKQLRRKQRMAS